MTMNGKMWTRKTQHAFWSWTNQSRIQLNRKCTTAIWN